MHYENNYEKIYNESPKSIITSSIIVENEKKQILLINSPRRGWVYPGGQVEEFESIKLAGIREVKEETGFDVEIERFCGIYQNIKKGICNVLFLGKLLSGFAKTSYESIEVGFFDLDEVRKKVKYQNFLERIELCLDINKQPFFIDF